jgi:hypothetical protein
LYRIFGNWPRVVYHRGVRSLRTLLALSALVLAGCGQVGSVRVALVSGDEAATADVRSLTFVVVAEGAVPQVFGPLGRDQGSARLETDVPFDTRFFVDVFGCPDAGRCDAELAIVRGCTDLQEISADEPQRNLEIALVAIDASGCPPGF